MFTIEGATGAIVWDEDHFNLSEDMVESSLPNGILVYAGWYPEGDSQGEYIVTAMKGLDLIHRERCGTDPVRVIEAFRSTRDAYNTGTAPFQYMLDLADTVWKSSRPIFAGAAR